MTIRFRAASAASMALVLRAQHGVDGLRQVFLEHAERGQVASRTATSMYARKDWKKAAEKYEEVVDARRRDRAVFPSCRPPTSSSATATTSSTSPPSRGTPTNDAYIQKAIENYRKAADKNTDKAWKKSALAVPGGRLRLRQAERPGQGRAGLPGDHRPRARTSPANYMALAKLYEDAGRYDDAEAQFDKAKEVKPNDPSASWPASPATTTARGTSRRRSRRSSRPPRSSPTTPRATTASPSSTGTRPAATSACRTPRSATSSRRGWPWKTRRSASTPTTWRR